MKYVVVTGGVLSGLGKGITASSLGRLLAACGHRVTAIKIDPYLNIDAGTMNPFEHGEVFVLDDGTEVDLDLGNYERFLDRDVGSDNNITTGKVYKSVIDKERRGDYLGKTVQIVPHVVNEIQRTIEQVATRDDADVAIVELGGTVGDIESMPFLEAVRQLHLDHGHKDVVFIHTTLVPVIGVVGEQKTKPTQHSVKELRSIGIQPDIVVGRADEPLDEKTKKKIALFCDVPVEAVVSAPDAESIYAVPLLLKDEGLLDAVLRRLGEDPGLVEPDLASWKDFVDRVVDPDHRVRIAIVGKYTDLADSYMSINEAFVHAGAALRTRVDVQWIESEAMEADPATLADRVDDLDGLLVPGGFGERGAEGKIAALRIAREQGLPTLGICYGFQLACVEYARHVLDLADANTTENDPDTDHPVICLLPEQRDVADMGGTMRLGGYPVLIDRESNAFALYQKEEVRERHRHRYEVNPSYIDKLEEAGLRFSGRSPDRVRMEIAELASDVHPYFVASQFHPEFCSRPESPAPLFYGLVEAALERAKAEGRTGVA